MILIDPLNLILKNLFIKKINGYITRVFKFTES